MSETNIGGETRAVRLCCFGQVEKLREDRAYQRAYVSTYTYKCADDLCTPTAMYPERLGRLLYR